MRRLFVVVLHDLLAACVAWVVAFYLRYNFDVPGEARDYIWQTVTFVVTVQAAFSWRFGLYRGIWRFASIPDLQRIGMAVAVSALVVPLVLFMWNRLAIVPRSVLVIDPILLVMLMGGSRFLYRAWKDQALISFQQLNAEPVVILGAGNAAAMLLRDLNASAHWRPVALFDDDRDKAGLHLLSIPILGPLSCLAEHVPKLGVKHAIVAMPSASVAVRRRAAEMAVNMGLKVLTIPAMGDILDGKVSVSQVRSVELEDLLGREPVQLDNAGLLGLFSGQTILVSGAGGSIGSELCRQVARYAPARIVFLELSEFSLYRIEQEFSSKFASLESVFIVGDVKDEALLERVFSTYCPVVVFHAAAYKHVPLMENANAWQAVRNNVLGTLRLAQAAARHDVREFVLVSTDKAVNPTNVMGATKRLAERVCQVMQAIAPATRFVMVRFGNVLGSSGSVIPKFREQIAVGGPVTVTHRDITRYFMLIPEACQLVLQAGLQANECEEGGRVFVLDMGEPVRIYDLARDMIRLSGYTEEEIRIEVTGLRPGEKLYEELLADSEQTLSTPHPKLRIAKPEQMPEPAWLQEIEAWLSTPLNGEAETKQRLQQYVPEYTPAQH